MSLTHRHDLPRTIRRGIAEVLTLDVYDAAGAQQTMASGTISIYAGSRLVVDGAAVSTLGPPATYSLPGATTTAEALSDRWLEVWTMVDGSGGTQVFQRPAYLVLRKLDPVITDTDLTDVHSDLADLRDPDQTTYEAQRSLAWTKLQKMLIQKGHRPQLIVDAWQLKDVHVAITLELIFRDFSVSVGDGKYLRMADDYREQIDVEFGKLQLTYDFDEDGQVDGEEERKAGQPVVFMSSSHGAF